MYASVQRAWHDLTVDIEGEVSFMYLDILGLVTVGVGNLVDPMHMAQALPFQFKPQNALGVPAGQRATPAEIGTEWSLLKNHPTRVRLMAGGHTLCRPLTNLELSPQDLLALFNAKTASNEATLRHTFVHYDRWPADAQLGVMSMAWALGAGFTGTWPKFTAACTAEDFLDAAAQCNIRGGGGIARRNTADVQLFTNAGRVVNNPTSYVRSTLYYPVALFDEIAI